MSEGRRHDTLRAGTFGESCEVKHTMNSCCGCRVTELMAVVRWNESIRQTQISLPPWSQGTEGIEELGGLCKWSALSLRGNAVVEIMCFTQAQADSLMMTRFEV